MTENAVACNQAKQAGSNPRLGGCGSFESITPEVPIWAICLSCRKQDIIEPDLIASIPPPSPVGFTSEETTAFMNVIEMAQNSSRVTSSGAQAVDRTARQATIASAQAALERALDVQRWQTHLQAFHAENAAPTAKATQSAAARKGPEFAEDITIYSHRAHDDSAAYAALVAPSTKATQPAAVPARATRSRTSRTSSPPVVEAPVKVTRSAAARKAPAAAVTTPAKATKSVATRSPTVPAVATPSPAPRGRKRKSSDDISEAKRPAPGLRRSPRNAGR